ncbi:expressed unknown protein [Seminavis robusta]|uniref:Uncharacterized protein n=1 Tax=Seminavis robusta TaxID=568900 RepID=A0A9N8E7L6_9STRA|nr:expressed unknown protein [Seminavis robusta]|eukprot:Sro582_g170450.1 n/a (222) ;mRNA; f:14651-15316
MGAAASSSTIVPEATDRDFDHVHRIPASVMVDSFKAGTQPGEVYELNMKTNPRGRITYANDATTFPLKIKGGSRMLLEDRETKKVHAFIYRGDGNQYQIYSLKPCHEGQEHSTNRQNPGQQLYEWATIKQVKDKKQCYQMESRDYPKNPTVYTAQPTRSGNSLLVECGRLTCGMIKRGRNEDGSFSDPFWNIKIGPGIDPALFLCFVAIVDELLMNGSSSR